MERKYTALRFIANLMKVLGIIVAVLTAFVAIGICGTSVLGGTALDNFVREFGQETWGVGLFTGSIIGLILAILPVLLGSSLALFLYAAGEAVHLQISIEENTRSTAWYLQQQIPMTGPASPTPIQPTTFQEPSEPAPPAGEPVYRFCPQCGTPIEAGAESCQACGYVIT